MKHIHVAALLALGLLLFGLNAGGYALWPADEPRFAEAAREMMLTGDYLVPRVNGEVYLEKPPLLFWLISLFSLPLGEVTEWSARMPSILSALAVILFTFLLARDWFGPRVGFWSALVLMTCVRFWWQARTAQIDMLLTACMMLSLWALWRWHTEHRARFLLAVYLGVALGLLAKGPPALVFPLLTMVTFYWRRKAERRRLHWALGLLAALVLVACWYVPARFAAAEAPATALEAGIGGNLFRNTLGRFLLGVSKFQPPWYYFETIPVDLFPWSLYLPWTLPWIWKHRRDSESIGFLLAWTVPALIFFSISLGKRAIYILPLFPAFAILLAASILALAESGHLTWQRRTGYAWGALLLLLGTAPFALPWTRYPEALSPEVTATGLLMLVLSAYSLRSARRPGVGLHLLMASQFAVVLLMGALFVLPAVDQYKSAKDITSPVRALSEAKADFDLFSVGFSSEEYLFYARHFHEPVLTSLIGEDKIPPDKLMDAAKQQKAAREVITEAVEEVPVSDMARITPDERTALRTAIDQAIASAGEEVEGVRQFETSLVSEIDAFAARFAGDRPAFMFVQDEDWRWLLPMFSTPPPYHVLGHEIVGSRYILLLANKAGAILTPERISQTSVEFVVDNTLNLTYDTFAVEHL